MPNQTREANQIGGDAVVMNLKSKLEDVQRASGNCVLTDSFQDTRDANCPPIGSPNSGSERTWMEAPAPVPDGCEEEEVFVIDEFSWDVYEAAAILAERIKAAAGVALLRDSLGMTQFHVAAPTVAYTAASIPTAVDDADTEHQVEGETQDAAQIVEASEREGLAVSGQEVQVDSSALVPPRVSSSEDAGHGMALLVGPSEMEETWTLIDGFRVRLEMLPGGLLPERDQVFEELNFLLGGLQNWEPCGEAWHDMPSFLQLSEMVRFSTRVQDIETHYLTWAEDKNAAPFDDASKQHVCDWLSAEGEKDQALEQLRNSGARRCKGAEAEADAKNPCRKLLRHELYKGNAQRCPLCKRPSKRAMALSANKKLAGSEVAPLLEGTEEPPVAPEAGRRRVQVEARFITVAEVEARELAFAVYGGEMNTYYRALVLPSDVAFGREAKTPVTVSWIDFDQSHRNVPPFEVILLDDPWARDVREANAAHWDNSIGRLMPGGDADAKFLIGAEAGSNVQRHPTPRVIERPTTTTEAEVVAAPGVPEAE